jgi:hypothetical protein
LVLLILLTDARVLTQPTERLIHHREHIIEEAPFRFDLIDGSLQVMEGQSVTLRFAVSGKEIPQAVYVEYNDQQFVLDEDSVRTHSYTFRNVRNTLSFRLYASGHYAGPYTLEVIPAPRIVGFTAHLEYPQGKRVPSQRRRSDRSGRNSHFVEFPNQKHRGCIDPPGGFHNDGIFFQYQLQLDAPRTKYHVLFRPANQFTGSRI